MVDYKRRLERNAKYEREEAEQRREEAREEARKEALSMWERIEEADASADVKDILHRIACQTGLET
jgi:hypothetical protein